MKYIILIIAICFGININSQTVLDTTDIKNVASYILYLENKNSKQAEIIEAQKKQINNYEDLNRKFQNIDRLYQEQSRIYSRINNNIRDIVKETPWYKDPYVISTAVLITTIIIAR